MGLQSCNVLRQNTLLILRYSLIYHQAKEELITISYSVIFPYSIVLQMFFGYVLVFTLFIPLFCPRCAMRRIRPSQWVNGFLISSYTADQVCGFNLFLCWPLPGYSFWGFPRCVHLTYYWNMSMRLRIFVRSSTKSRKVTYSKISPNTVGNLRSNLTTAH